MKQQKTTKESPKQQKTTKQDGRKDLKTATKKSEQQFCSLPKNPENKRQEALNRIIQEIRNKKKKKLNKRITTTLILIIILQTGFIIGYIIGSPYGQLIFVERSEWVAAWYTKSTHNIYIKTENKNYIDLTRAFWHEYTHHLIKTNNNKTLIQEIKKAYDPKTQPVINTYAMTNWEEAICEAISIGQNCINNPYHTTAQANTAKALIPTEQTTPCNKEYIEESTK